MVTVSAHFDGKVIVPDEPLDLAPNQALIVQIQRVGGEAVPEDESALTWLAANAVDSEALPTDMNRNLAPHNIEACYRDVAADQAREHEAMEWSEGLIRVAPKNHHKDN